MIKNKLLLITLSASITGFLLWSVAYALIPYGNHFLIVWGVGYQENNKVNQLIYSKTASKLFLKIVGASCSLPLLDHNGFRLGQYIPSNNNAISRLISLSDNKKYNLNSEQKDFILQHLYKTIKKCDVNIEDDGVSPLFNAILARNPSIVSALIKRNVNINQRHTDTEAAVIYTPLYTAEMLLITEKDEAAKQSLNKIIEIMKVAGAISEVKAVKAKSS
jgi:hypothetical protein